MAAPPTTTSRMISWIRPLRRVADWPRVASLSRADRSCSNDADSVAVPAMLVTGAPCRMSATRLGRAAAGLEPALEGTCVHVQQVQAELGAPPQNVLRGARKFLAAQVLHLALVQLRQQLASQVRERAGGPEQALEARAVRMGVAPAHARGQPRIV